jgi:voltage-gated potassium channel
MSGPSPIDPEGGARPTTATRLEWLARIERWLDVSMMVLGFVWLGLLIWELIGDLSPLLEAAGLAIWGLFILDFALEFILAPRKADYLTRNWLTALSLVVPALRFFRIVRVLRVWRATRGLRLVKVVGSLNRGMRALGASMGRRGVGYVAALTLLVTLGGAAGMYALENDPPGGLHSYGEALWWTAMIMTTMGSQYWPRSPEGRVLCVLLALYAFAMFGYFTAALATYFIGRDAERDDAELAGARAIQALRTEISALRAEVGALRDAKPR